MLIGFHQLFTWPPPSQKRYKALKLDLAYSASRFCDEVLKEAGHPPNRQLSSEGSRERVYLGQEPGNIKALYRRAQGLLGSNDFEEAPVLEAARMGHTCRNPREPGRSSLGSVTTQADPTQQTVRGTSTDTTKLNKQSTGGFLIRAA